MLSVVLVTPLYRETAHPAGLCTASLAHAFSEAGYDVHVICSMTGVPRPRHEFDAGITIHRLETCRDSHPLAFAIQAARRTYELARSGRCDAIECIDSTQCLLAHSILRESGVIDAPVIELIVRGDHQHTDLANASVAVHDRAITSTNIPFPIQDQLLPVPPGNTPVFVACDAITPEQQQPILQAFKDSDAPEQGWSLALRTPNLSWSIHEHTKSPTQNHTSSVYLSVDDAVPVAPAHAIFGGYPCIISDRSPLAGAIPSEHVYNSSDPCSLIRTLQTVMHNPVSAQATPVNWADTRNIVDAHRRLWDQSSPAFHTQNRLNLWRTIEQHASAVGSAEISP